MKQYTRTEDGTTTNVSIREGLDEINRAQMAGRREVRTMSSISRTDFAIEYKDGRKVRLVVTEAPAEVVVESALIQRRQGGDLMGRVVTVKGKRYVTAEITPADRPVHKHAPKDWKPTAYVTYWSERNGERFGATRTAGPESKPGTAGHGIWVAVNR